MKDDESNVFRGILYACLFGIPLWLLIFWGVSALATEKQTPTKPPVIEETANSTATATSSSAADSVSLSNSDASGQSVSFDTDSLALGFADPTTAAPVFTRCHESRGGKHIVAFSFGARVEINPECQAFEQCLARVAVYRELGRPEMALAELEACGGQPVPEVVTTPLVEPSTALLECEERTERLEAACTDDGK